MPGLVVKKLPPDLHARLRDEASRNHRSMTGEVIAILSRVLPPRRTDVRAELEEIRRGRPRLLRRVSRREWDALARESKRGRA